MVQLSLPHLTALLQSHLERRKELNRSGHLECKCVVTDEYSLPQLNTSAACRYAIYSARYDGREKLEAENIFALGNAKDLMDGIEELWRHGNMDYLTNLPLGSWLTASFNFPDNGRYDSQSMIEPLISQNQFGFNYFSNLATRCAVQEDSDGNTKFFEEENGRSYQFDDEHKLYGHRAVTDSLYYPSTDSPLPGRAQAGPVLKLLTVE